METEPLVLTKSYFRLFYSFLGTLLLLGFLQCTTGLDQANSLIESTGEETESEGSSNGEETSTAGEEVSTPVESSFGTLTINKTLIHDFLGKVCPIPEQTYAIDLEEEDTNAAQNTYIIETDPNNGTAEISENKLLYTPNDGFFGNDMVEVMAKYDDGTQQKKVLDLKVSLFESELPDKALLKDQGFVHQAVEDSYTSFHGISSPSITYVPSAKTYVMFFETKFENPVKDPNCTRRYDWGIGVAYSKDLKSWTLHPEPIVSPGNHPDFACVAAHVTSLTTDGKKWKLWFKMHPEDGKQDGIGYATLDIDISKDSFVPGKLKYLGKLTSGETSFPSVVQVNGVIFLYFFVADKYPASHISMIYSEDDGTTWLPDANLDDIPEPIAVLYPGDPWTGKTQWAEWNTQLLHPSVVCDPNDEKNLLQMFVVSRQRETKVPFTVLNEMSGILTSPNAKDFFPSDKIALLLNPKMGNHQELAKYGDGFLLLSGDNDINGKKGIKLFTTPDLLTPAK